MRNNEIKFSIHFDENGEVVAVTEPPREGIEGLHVAEEVGESSVYFEKSMEHHFPLSPTFVITRDTSQSCTCCTWVRIPGNGIVRICWSC